jgi:hypothetical protein
MWGLRALKITCTRRTPDTVKFSIHYFGVDGVWSMVWSGPLVRGEKSK